MYQLREAQGPSACTIVADDAKMTVAVADIGENANDTIIIFQEQKLIVVDVTSWRETFPCCLLEQLNAT